jgi:hypothetical protein
MTPADKIAAYLDKILWKGNFHYRGAEYPPDAQKVFIDTLVAVPAGDDDLSVGDLKAMLVALNRPG